MTGRRVTEKTLTPEEFRAYVLGFLTATYDAHSLPALTDAVLARVEAVERAWFTELGYDGSQSSIVVRLTNPPEWGLFHEWSDYSGHG